MEVLIRYGFFLFIIIILGCKPDDYELPPYLPKLVVEGSIEQNGFPIVYLTYSKGFYEPVDSSEFLELINTTARVAVSDGEREEVLTLFRNADIFPPFYYRGTDLRGQVGKEYRLEIRFGFDTLIAYTTIPDPVFLDSIWFEPLPEVDTSGNIRGSFTDNANQVNYYRVFTQVIGKDSRYIPIFQSTVSDEFFNGESFSFSIFKGSSSLNEITNDNFYHLHDTVRIRVCTMDQPHFDFWRTLEREQSLAGNPFGSAGNRILSNISGTTEALGVWGGYGATYYRFIIKK